MMEREDIERGGGGGGGGEEVSEWDQKWKRERWRRRRERRHEDETTQQGWTVVHSLWCISVTLPTSHAERSPLNCFAKKNTDDGEGGHREKRRRRRGECVGSEMEEREMETGEET